MTLSFGYRMAFRLTQQCLRFNFLHCVSVRGKQSGAARTENNNGDERNYWYPNTCGKLNVFCLTKTCGNISIFGGLHSNVRNPLPRIRLRTENQVRSKSDDINVNMIILTNVCWSLTMNRCHVRLRARSLFVDQLIGVAKANACYVQS